MRLNNTTTGAIEPIKFIPNNTFLLSNEGKEEVEARKIKML